ncbi:hypothetical protein BGZ83_005230 [Gryganskiella cystojenkinii]|nr:hypothetical protein BGZ83_005230 [Gryganskiella cystojenkinii]
MLKTTTTLEDPKITNEGLAMAAFNFNNLAASSTPSNPSFYPRRRPIAALVAITESRSATKSDTKQHQHEDDDDERYGRGGYATAMLIPTGPEFTVAVTRNGTKTNSLIQGCQGGCQKEPWYLGLDQGFAALAGVKPEKAAAGCSMVLVPMDQSNDKIRQEILRVCNGRCAQFVYKTTRDLSKRIDPPGYRTFVALLSNWSAWVSCSMYEALTEWSSRLPGCQDFAWADTLNTSKIRFVDAKLQPADCRDHEPGLLNKGPGWEDEGSAAWIRTCEKYGLRGTYMRQSIGFLALMYEIGMYNKGPLAWSCMALDTKFFVDYNLASDNSPCNSWWNHVDKYSREAIIDVVNQRHRASKTADNDIEKKYVASYAVGCSFAFGASQVKQRREQEAGSKAVAVRRGGVIWEDRELWSSYLIVDSGTVQMALMAGGCVDDLGSCVMARIVNDVIDLGYDWGSGDVCNSILTMTDGKTDRISLSRAYVKVAAIINRLSTMRPDSVASVSVIVSHAWQMCNSRHRVMPCALVSNDVGLGPIEVSATWYEVGILNLDPTKKVNLAIKPGQLMDGKQVELTARSWALLAKDATGMVAKLLFHGHLWLVDLRRARNVATAGEIVEVEDTLRILLVTMAMELERADFIEALWCWTIESWCATDMMWHAMIGSTALSSERKIGSDRWDDENKMDQWNEIS